MPSISVPTDVNCPKQYTCTLAGTAEVRGDHVATLVLPEHLNGEWKLPGDVSWIGFRTASFLFTSAGETYDLRFSTPASTVGDNQLVINYTVGAIYAPAWASIKAVITASRAVEPCCGVGAAPTSGFSTVVEALSASHRSTSFGNNVPPCAWAVNNQYLGGSASTTYTSSGSSLIGYNVPALNMSFSFTEISGTITASVNKANGNVTLTQSNAPAPSPAGFTCVPTGGIDIVTSSPICVATDLGARVWVRLRAQVQHSTGRFNSAGVCFSQVCSAEDGGGSTQGTNRDCTVHEIRLESAAAP